MAQHFTDELHPPVVRASGDAPASASPTPHANAEFAIAGGPINALALDLVEALMDQLPYAPYCLKDPALRYVSVNSAMVHLCGARERGEILGKTAREFFPDASWRRHEQLERQVMRTGKPVKDRLDLSVRSRGPPVWLLVGQWPVADRGGKIEGVATMARRLEQPDRRHPTYARLAQAVEHIQRNFAAPLDVADLARRAGVSVSQLERDFVSLFGLPPRRYLTKIRFEAALEMLRAGRPIVEIAHACGYGDQSAFTRRFTAAVGMAPSKYRRSSSSPR